MYSMHRNQGHLVNWGWFLALAHEQNVSKGSLTIINRWQGLCNQTRLNIFPVNVLETGQKFYNPLFHSPEFSIPHRANDFLEDIKRFSDFKKTQRRFKPAPTNGCQTRMAWKTWLVSDIFILGAWHEIASVCTRLYTSLEGPSDLKKRKHNKTLFFSYK